MAEFSAYAGRWIALTEQQEVAGVGFTAQEALYAARAHQPRQRLSLVWVSPHAPHIALPDWPLFAVGELLQEYGAWLVGGTVRDLLLRRTPHDWDFVVRRGALTLARRVADRLGGSYYPLDIERETGRAVVSLRSTGPVVLDFAVLRGDGTIEDDLRLRDFTVNAMALTLQGEILDPTDGQTDLAAKRLRITGAQSFAQDPLRLLRAVRLAHTLELTIEDETRRSLQAQVSLLPQVASERIQTEFQLMLSSDRALGCADDLHRFGLLPYLFPELAALPAQALPPAYAQRSAWHHAMATLAHLEAMGRLLLHTPENARLRRYEDPPRWALATLSQELGHYQAQLLTNLGTPLGAAIDRMSMLRLAALCAPLTLQHLGPDAPDGGSVQEGLQQIIARLETLRYPNRAIDFVARALRARGYLADLAHKGTHPTPPEVYRYFRATGDAGTGGLLLYLAQVLAARGDRLKPDLWQHRMRLAHWLLRGYFDMYAEWVEPTPLLNGTELIGLGVTQGPAVGAALERLRLAQVAGEVASRAEAEAYIRAHLETSEL